MNQNIPIFVASSDEYTVYLAPLLVSILENTDSVIDFYIIDGGITTYKRRQLERLVKERRAGGGIEFINPEPFRDKLEAQTTNKSWVPLTSSDRLFAPYMKPEIERGIILDTDMIALGDIKELWDVDLKGRVCGAVPIYNLTSMEYLREITNIIGIKLKHIYMNMGTLLVDFKKWRETDMLAKLASIPIHFDTEKYCAWDEMLLNAVLQETGYTILDPKFNMSNPLLTYYKKGKPIEHRQVIEDYIGLSPDYRPLEIVLLHYVHAKPLYSPYFQYPPLKTKINVDGYKEFWNFLSMTPFYAGEYMSLFVNKSQLMHASLLKILKSGTYRRKLALYRILNALTFGLIPGLKRKKEKVKEQLSLDIW